MRLWITLCALLICTGSARLRAAESSPDLATPAMQDLRREYLSQREELKKQTVADLAKALEAPLAEARQMAAKARVSGNISGQASAKAAVNVFEGAQAELKAKGSVTLPERTRRELEQMVETCRRQLKAIEDASAASLAVLESAFEVRLRAVLDQQGTPVAEEADRRSLLAKLAGMPDPAAPAAAGTGGVTNAAGSSAAGAAPALPDVLASSGEAKAWLALARGEIEVNALEVITLPVAGLDREHTVSGEGPISGAAFAAKLTPLRVLVGDGAPVFRLRSVPGSLGVDAVAWPSSRNNWSLDVRSRPGGGLPSRHAFLLEVGDGTAEVKEIAGIDPGDAPADSAATGRLVRVSFTSDPPGAFVMVDGRVLARNARALTTPFEYPISPRPAEIRFRKRAYVDAVYPRVAAADGASLNGRLQPDPNYVTEKISVSASGKGWQATRIRVKPGQTVRIAAGGSWRCGADGEMTDAGGYPNDATFFKYYLDPARHPRLVNGSNYGALLVKVMPDGKPEAAGTRFSFQPDKEGTLAFDINESTTARQDNQGAVSVQVLVEPSR